MGGVGIAAIVAEPTAQLPDRATTSAQRSSSAAAAASSGRLGPHVRDRLGRVGQHEHPAAVVLDDPHAVGGVERPAAGRLDNGAHDHALGGPRRRDGAARDVAARDPRVDLGQRRAGSAPRGRRSRTKAAMPSTPWRTRDDEAAATVAAEDHAGLDDGLGQCGGRGARPSAMSTPWNAATCSATRVVVTGSATRAAAPLGGDQVEHHQQRPLVVDRSGRCSSTRAIRSPTGSKCTPKAARDDATSSPEPAQGLGAAPPPSRSGDASSSPLLTVSTSSAEPAEQCGQDQRRGAAAGVDDDLEPALGDPGGVDRPQQLEGVALHDAGREDEVADLARERAPELPRGEDPLQLALAGLATGRRRAGRGTRCPRSRADPGVVRMHHAAGTALRRSPAGRPGTGDDLEVDAR